MNYINIKHIFSVHSLKKINNYWETVYAVQIVMGEVVTGQQQSYSFAGHLCFIWISVIIISTRQVLFVVCFSHDMFRSIFMTPNFQNNVANCFMYKMVRKKIHVCTYSIFMWQKVFPNSKEIFTKLAKTFYKSFLQIATKQKH